MLLYHSLTSPYSRKARVVLMEKGVSYEAVNVAESPRSPSEHNPLGKVPTLVLDDALVVFDSTVITETLDALYPNPRLIPEAPLERAQVRRWEALADGICDVLIPAVLESRRPPERQDPAYLGKLEGKVHAALGHTDAWVAERRYIHGSDFSLADVALVCAVGYLNLRRPQLLEQHAPTRAFCERLLERRSLAETVPPDLPVRG